MILLNAAQANALIAPVVEEEGTKEHRCTGYVHPHMRIDLKSVRKQGETGNISK